MSTVSRRSIMSIKYSDSQQNGCVPGFKGLMRTMNRHFFSGFGEKKVASSRYPVLTLPGEISFSGLAEWFP